MTHINNVLIIDGPHSNDIAVVSIGVGPEGIPFSSHVRPICLPKGPPPPGPCDVTGWGSINGIFINIYSKKKNYVCTNNFKFFAK